MALTLEHRLAIHELIALHGHLVDNGEFDRFNELFTLDVVYDLQDFGRGELHGIDAVIEAALALGDGNPIGHHVTNTLITEFQDDEVRVLSKAIGIRANGTSGSLVYEDIVRRGATVWRIARRRVVMRRRPLHR